MYRPKPEIRFVGTLLVLLFALFIPTLSAQPKELSLKVDGVQYTPDFPMYLANDRTLMPIELIADCLEIPFSRNDTNATMWIQQYNNTVFFATSSGEVRVNGNQVMPPVPPRFVGEQYYVPLRFVAENLGVRVEWMAEDFEVQLHTGKRQRPAERIESPEFDAVVAYVDKGSLWFLDGRKPGEPVRQISSDGKAELIGWSFDAQYLAYTQRNEDDSRMVLSVIDVDGRPVWETRIGFDTTDPVWSPVANVLVYVEETERENGIVSANTVKLADFDRETIETTDLSVERLRIIPSLAWHPDGKSVTVSLPRTDERPPVLEQLSLDGQRTRLLTYQDEEPVDLENLYPWAFVGVQWSPDAQHIAYHVRMNSGSLTADGVSMNVAHVASGKVVQLGEGLKYPQWMSFSPNADRLAFVSGIGRDVQVNKRLEVVELTPPYMLSDLGVSGRVDVQPVWLQSGELLFCRGVEAKTAPELSLMPAPLVQDQRIVLMDAKGSVRNLGKEDPQTADYYPSPSLSGEQMLFLRLERFDLGSLYLASPDSTEGATEILRGLSGDPGYYGNYYPQWISVHWFN